jgi:hypothetical protein
VAVDPGWLAARVAADTAARAATIDTLLPELINYLIKTGGPQAVVEIIDLGAGTGANQRWLAPRLPLRQRWIHLDHNPVISRSLPLPDDTMIIDESVEVLSRLLASPSVDQRLVTCSALLDVLTTDQIHEVCGALIDNRAPGLFSLTVTGTFGVSPTNPHDQQLLDAFNDHQRRAGMAGPNAVNVALDAMLGGGFTVRTQETPWHLIASNDPAFVEQLLRERLEAAVAQDTSLATTAATWFELRRTHLSDGILRIDLGHLDILALPERL